MRKPPCCSWQGGTSKDKVIFCFFITALFCQSVKDRLGATLLFPRSEQEVRGSPLQGVVCSSRKQAAVNAPCSELPVFLRDRRLLELGALTSKKAYGSFACLCYFVLYVFALAHSRGCDRFHCARKPPSCSWPVGTSNGEAVCTVFVCCQLSKTDLVPLVFLWNAIQKGFVAVLSRVFCGRREDKVPLVLCVPRVAAFFKAKIARVYSPQRFKQSLRVICMLVILCFMFAWGMCFAGSQPRGHLYNTVSQHKPTAMLHFDVFICFH